MKNYLTFGDLNNGDTFISVPIEEGDPSKPYFMFIKVSGVFGNAMRLHDGMYSKMPKSMPVVKLL